ncbi:unnamed protein product, partial [Orchesella dallaii]
MSGSQEENFEEANAASPPSKVEVIEPKPVEPKPLSLNLNDEEAGTSKKVTQTDKIKKKKKGASTPTTPKMSDKNLDGAVGLPNSTDPMLGLSPNRIAKIQNIVSEQVMKQVSHLRITPLNPRVDIPTYDSRRMTSNTFFKRCEDYFRSQGFHEYQFHTVVSVIMQDDMKGWYDNVACSITSWKDFCSQFRDRYDNVQVQEKRKKRLYNRKQQLYESVEQFVHEMVNLARQIDPAEDTSLSVERAKNALHPDLVLGIGELHVKTVNNLIERAGIAIEAIRARDMMYKDKPRTMLPPLHGFRSKDEQRTQQSSSRGFTARGNGRQYDSNRQLDNQRNRQEFRPRINSLPTDANNVYLARVKCHECHEFGHKSMYCPKKGRKGTLLAIGSEMNNEGQRYSSTPALESQEELYQQFLAFKKMQRNPQGAVDTITAKHIPDSFDYELEILIAEFPTVCRKDGTIGQTDMIVHEIELLEDKVFKERPRTFPIFEATEIDRQCKDLLKHGKDLEIQEIIRGLRSSNVHSSAATALQNYVFHDGILRKRIKSLGISLSTDDTVEASVNNLSNFNYRDSLIVSGTNASRGPSEHEAESGQIRVNSHIASRGPSEHEAESGQIRVNSHIASRGPSENEAESGQIRVNLHVASRGPSENVAETQRRANDAQERALLAQNNDNESRKLVIVLPGSLKYEVLSYFHNTPEAGHFGRKKTYLSIRQRFYWNRMEKDIADFVRSCQVCQKYKSDNLKRKGLLGEIPIAESVFETLYLDFIGRLPTSKHRRNKYILVCVDQLSGWVE